jgi:hypothetical protein
MSTQATTKIGPTLDDLKVFYKATDDAMDAIAVLYDLVVTDDATNVWGSIQTLISEISIDQTDGHPAYPTWLAERMADTA